MPNDAGYPRYFDVLCAAVLNIWLVISAGLFIFILLQNDGTLLEAIAAPFILLLVLLIPTFVIGGLISYPFWRIARHLNCLNRSLAGFVGGLTGLIIGFIPFFLELRDYLNASSFNAYSDDIKTNLIFMLFSSLLGALAGWNGYRVAERK